MKRCEQINVDANCAAMALLLLEYINQHLRSEKVISAYKSFPRQHWRRIRTANGLERINKELKRRSRVSGAYSNDQPLLRVAVCIMMDINEDWITGNRYLSLEE